MRARPGTGRRPSASQTGSQRGGSRGPVSPSAARFEARARAARWRARRRVLIVLLIGGVLAAVSWASWSGPLLRVRGVQVVGLHGAEAAQAEGFGAPYLNRPLPQVDVASIEREVEQLPYVRQVHVQRGWPSTLRLHVTRRVAVAAVALPGGGFALLDDTGRGFESVRKVPSSVPVMTLPVARRGEALTAALAVLAALPPPIRGSATHVSAASPANVQVRWRGRVLVWGTAQDLPLKARVLQALLRQPATIYDVSAPHTPVLR